MRHDLVAPLLVNEDEVVPIHLHGKVCGDARNKIPAYEVPYLGVIRTEPENRYLLGRQNAADGRDRLVVNGGRSLRPVEIIEIEYGKDIVVFDKCDLLIVEAADEAWRRILCRRRT